MSISYLGNSIGRKGKAAVIRGTANISIGSNAILVAQTILAPTGLRVDTFAQTTMNLEWDNNIQSFFAHFSVWESLNGTTFAQVASPVAVSAYTRTGLTAGRSYWYKVRAHSDFGGMADSNVIQQNTMPAAPLAPTIAGVTDTTITIAFPLSAALTHASWLVQRSTDGVNYSQVAIGITAANWTDTGRTPGTPYWYRLRDADAAGNIGPVGAAVSQTTTASAARVGILYTLNFSTAPFTANVRNPIGNSAGNTDRDPPKLNDNPLSSGAATATSVDGINWETANVPYDKEGGLHDDPPNMLNRRDDTRAAEDQLLITDAFNNAPPGERGIVFRLLAPNSMIRSTVSGTPTDVPMRYDLHGTANRARSRISLNPNWAFQGIWDARPNAGKGHREVLWIGFCLWLPSTFRYDGHTSGEKGTRHQFFEWFSRLISPDVSCINFEHGQMFNTGSNTFGERINLSLPGGVADNGHINKIFNFGYTGGVHAPINWIGKRNYFVIKMRTDDRAPPAGNPEFEMWHSTDNVADGHGKIADMRVGFDVGSDPDTPGQRAYGGYQDTFDGVVGFDNGFVCSMRIYKPGWYDNWYYVDRWNAGLEGSADSANPLNANNSFYRGNLRPTMFGTYTRSGSNIVITLTDNQTKSYQDPGGATRTVTNLFPPVAVGNVIAMSFQGSGAVPTTGNYTVAAVTGAGTGIGSTVTVPAGSTGSSSGTARLEGHHVVQGLSSFRMGGANSNYRSVHPLNIDLP